MSDPIVDRETFSLTFIDGQTLALPSVNVRTVKQLLDRLEQARPASAGASYILVADDTVLHESWGMRLVRRLLGNSFTVVLQMSPWGEHSAKLRLDGRCIRKAEKGGQSMVVSAEGYDRGIHLWLLRDIQDPSGQCMIGLTQLPVDVDTGIQDAAAGWATFYHFPGAYLMIKRPHERPWMTGHIHIHGATRVPTPNDGAGHDLMARYTVHRASEIQVKLDFVMRRIWFANADVGLDKIVNSKLHLFICVGEQGGAWEIARYEQLA